MLELLHTAPALSRFAAFFPPMLIYQYCGKENPAQYGYGTLIRQGFICSGYLQF